MAAETRATVVGASPTYVQVMAQLGVVVGAELRRLRALARRHGRARALGRRAARERLLRVVLRASLARRDDDVRGARRARGGVGMRGGQFAPARS